MKQTLRVRAIRGAWAVARASGLALPVALPRLNRGLMDTDEVVRMTVVRAWEAGYRHGRRDGRTRRECDSVPR